MVSFDFNNPEDRKKYHQRYVLGEGVEYRYEAFIEEVLEVDLSEVQKQIVRSVEDNPRTACSTGNGFGKSYTLACLSLAWQYCNKDAFALVTGGNYSQLQDGYWSDLTSLHQHKLKPKNLPGETTNSRGDLRLQFSNRPEHKLRALSPKNPGSLEGKHSGRALVVIEEADKDTITDETITSAVSTVTDEHDRVLLVGNPPEFGHPFKARLEDDRYETLHFTAFESRNVQRELGNTDKPEIDGVITPYRIEDIWNENHDEEYPGLEEASHFSKGVRNDLSVEWYRRVMGETPPSSSTHVRPFTVEDVESSEKRYTPQPQGITYDAIGVDLAMSGEDKTVAIGVTPERADVLAEFDGGPKENKTRIEGLTSFTDGPIVIDVVRDEAITELLDVNVTRFKGSTSAEDDETYYNRRAESYGVLGDWLDDGGAIEPNSDLAEELYATARVLHFKRKGLKSSETYLLEKKDKVKARLGHSPDYADALSMAVHGLRAHSKPKRVASDVRIGDLLR